jgi:AraC-like DNA-binding protein
LSIIETRRSNDVAMVTSSILPPLRSSGPSSTPSALSEATRTLPSGCVHLGVAQEIPPTLGDFGIDPDPIIREAGLDPRLFDDGASIVSQAALGRLLTLSVERTRCPHFGLLVGRRATLLSLGMVGRLMQHSTTVGDALRVLVSNLSLQDPGTAPSLTVSGDTALFSFSVSRPGSESTDQISDGGLAVTVNVLRALCGSDWNPMEVLVPRTAPADREPYRRHFRAPVHFDQEVATLVLPARDLDRAVTGADPMLRAILSDQIQQMKSSQGSEFSDDIRRLLRTQLTSSRCSAEDIAELLKMHRRTLSRRLKDSGMGYREIANEIRFEIARQLLQDTQVPLAQIAAALGYSEASAFTRAFRRWSGRTPSAWRRGGHRDKDDKDV